MSIFSLNFSELAVRLSYLLLISTWCISISTSYYTHSCNMLFKIGRVKVVLLFMLYVGKLLVCVKYAYVHII